jgi:nucleoside-diphosphate-sugar epimerase
MADRLSAGGLRVRAMVRTPDQARMAARRGWLPVTGDLGVPESLRPAADGADLVVHAAAYLGRDRDVAEAVNVAGTRWLAEAALAAGVRRFVHISTMSVWGPAAGRAARIARSPSAPRTLRRHQGGR